VHGPAEQTLHVEVQGHGHHGGQAHADEALVRHGGQTITPQLCGDIQRRTPGEHLYPAGTSPAQ
jgi:hypothetical protein